MMLSLSRGVRRVACAITESRLKSNVIHKQNVLLHFCYNTVHLNIIYFAMRTMTNY